MAVVPVAWASAFDVTTGGFILAAAECDLDLNFFRKGLLVSMPYFGELFNIP